MRNVLRYGFWVGCMGLVLAALHVHVRAADKIVVDQVGYRPSDSKIAILRSSAKGNFEVINTVTTKSAFKGLIPPVGRFDQATGDQIYVLDFSSLHEPGRYVVTLTGSDISSAPFEIDNNPYRIATQITIEGFYYQRCGAELNSGTIWRHGICHPDDAVLYGEPDKKIECTGGWHDAGDYGKYVATGAVSAAFLLYLYEEKPASFTDGHLRIPECANSIPDILDEARWELVWLMKMQNADGGVYHKVSSKAWTGEHLPDHDPDKRYLFPVSSTATGASAAVFALGARLFQRWDKPFAASLLKASVLSWKYLTEHPDIVPEGGFRNPADVEGGEYGDANDRDERLWASVELYRTTGNVAYHQYFRSHYGQELIRMAPVSWIQVQDFALVSYTKHSSSKVEKKIVAEIIAKLTERCDNLVTQTKVSGYRLALGIDEYYWGSNSVDAGYGFDLIAAYTATKSQKYLDAALDQLHYLLGRNAFGLSFVTGIGSRRVMHPYHQFSMLIENGNPVPGMLAGGPNSTSRLKGTIISPYPGACYQDSDKNYFVNEVAINYTAPFVFLCGYFTTPLKSGSE